MHHFSDLQRISHLTAVEKGFWADADDPSITTCRIAVEAPAIVRMAREIETIRKPKTPFAEPKNTVLQLRELTPHQIVRLAKLVLIVTEVGEAIEAVLAGNMANLREEYADICIRLMDLAGFDGLELDEDILAKQAVNLGRPHMHGKLA